MRIHSSLVVVLAVSLTPALGAEKVARFALSTEPPNLNSMKATDQQSFFVIGHVMEGLTRIGKGGALEPGVAEKWKIDDQGAIFTLRKNARWADGKPVTAKDFVFAWKSALDPKMASEYAFILYPIKNAEAINQGKAEANTLGAEAINDTTLKVTFEKPCGYFLGLTSFSTYFPVREDFYHTKKDRYAADAGDLLSNGPFKLTAWTHGASLTMEKNPTYWNASKIKLDKIEIPYITNDAKARFNFFKDKKVDLLESIAKDELPLAMAERYKLQTHSDGSVFFMEFNFREGRPTTNKNLRRAIQLSLNMDEYINKVIAIPGTKPGKRLVPVWVRGVKDSFFKEYPYSMPKTDLAEARKALELAKKELGGKIPTLVWLTGDSPTAAREAEYFQAKFKQLGIQLTLDKQIFKQRLAKMSSGDFDIVSAGWGPDFADPMTFAELMASWNENNRGKWENKAFDRLVRDAQATSNPKKRMDAMAAAEKITLDELAIIPLYERTIIWTHHDRLQGVGRTVIGADPDFTSASVKD